MKRIFESISIRHERNRPRLFKWREKMYEVCEILDWWVIQTGWWLPEGDVRRVHFRVVVGPLFQTGTKMSGVMEMYRQKEEWTLTKIID